MKPQNYEDSFYATEVERGSNYNCNNKYNASKRSSSSKRGHKYCSFVNKWLKNRKKQTANGKWKTQIVQNAQCMAYKTLSSLPMYDREGGTLPLPLSLYLLVISQANMNGPGDRPTYSAVRLLCLFYYGIIFRSLCHFSTTYFKRLRRDKWPLRVSRPRLIEGPLAQQQHQQELELFNNKKRVQREENVE